MEVVLTSAVLRLECLIDCRSGSVGYRQNIFPFIFLLCQLIHTFWRKNNLKKQPNYNKLIGSVSHHQCYINWSSAPHPSYVHLTVNLCRKESALTIFSSLVFSSSVSYDDMSDLHHAVLFHIFHSSIVVSSSSSYSLCHRPGFCPRPTIPAYDYALLYVDGVI